MQTPPRRDRPYGVVSPGPGQPRDWQGPYSQRSLPALDPAWATDDPEHTYTPEQMRDHIRTMQDIPARMDELTSLTMAMNGCSALSPEAREQVKSDVIDWLKLRDKLLSINGSAEGIDGINISADGLPMIKADVVEWSDKMLGCCGKGGTYLEVVLAPFREAANRLIMRVCITLDLCSYGLENAPCCGLGGSSGNGWITPLIRS